MLNEEIWKDVAGFENLYQVSNFGRVKNHKGLVLKPYTNNNGYECIKLAGREQRNFLVHRLVAIAFIPTEQSNLTVNHIDFNRLNNRADNLEWCSTRQNLEHSRKAGRMPYNYPTLGKKLKGERKGHQFTTVCFVNITDTRTLLERSGWLTCVYRVKP